MMRNKIFINDYYRSMVDAAEKEVNSMDDTYLLTIDRTELAKYLFEKYSLPQVIIDMNRERKIEKTKHREFVTNRYGEEVEKELLFLKLYVPVIPSNKIGNVLGMMPSSYTSYYIEMSYSNGWVIIEVQFNENEAERAVKYVEQDLEWRNSDIEQGNRMLEQHINQVIDKRVKKVENENEILESIAKKISVTVEQKTEASAIIPTAVEYKKEVLSVIPPKATTPKVLILEPRKFEAILILIDNSGKQFERTPKTFAKLSEEELRDVILSNLNGVFEGAAVGEAFSKHGKTDIYLQVDEGGIFIAECKYWDGQSTLHEATNQILGYLTWRQSYGVVVIFVKRKSFTEILRTIGESISKLPGYKRGESMIAENHYKGLFCLPEDENKLVELHFIAYNLYTSH